MRTLDEFRKDRPRIVASRSPDLRMIAQEAVRMEALTGDEAWDHYNAYLEAALKTATRQMDDAKSHLTDSRLVNGDAIVAVKLSIAALEARIATLKEVLTLPKFLKDQGSLARMQIDDFEKGA